MNYLTNNMKLKRKEIEEVNDDFADFSFSSPATKIRRLNLLQDGELAPIVEEQEMTIPYVTPAEHLSGGLGKVRNSGLVIEELPSEPVNEERALVLFKPMNEAPAHSPSSFSVSMNPALLAHIKNKIWSSKWTPLASSEDESADAYTRDKCLAVVPWAPSKVPSAPETEVSELMDADDMGVASMDIEEENTNVGHVEESVFNGVSNPVQDSHQWQNQHCLVPPLPQNTSAPVVWFQ